MDRKQQRCASAGLVLAVVVLLCKAKRVKLMARSDGINSEVVTIQAAHCLPSWSYMKAAIEYSMREVDGGLEGCKLTGNYEGV